MTRVTCASRGVERFRERYDVVFFFFLLISITIARRRHGARRTRMDVRDNNISSSDEGGGRNKYFVTSSLSLSLRTFPARIRSEAFHTRAREESLSRLICASRAESSSAAITRDDNDDCSDGNRFANT